MLGELNKEQINNILQSQSICRLCCIDGDQTYIVPISYFFDGSVLFAQSREGKKIKLLRKNPKVCVEIDIINSMNNWQCVIAYGVFEELKDEAADSARKKIYDNVFTLMTNSKIHKFQHEEEDIVIENNLPKLVIFCIHITNATGRFEK